MKISVWRIEYGCEHEKVDFPKEKIKRFRKFYTNSNETESWFDGLHGCSNKKYEAEKPKKWCSKQTDLGSWSFLVSF